MNSDLAFRLKPYSELTDREHSFIDLIFCELSDTAFKRVPFEKATVDMCVRQIEEDGEDSAYTDGDGQYFTMHLDSRMPAGMVIDFIIHELAHVRSWHHYEKDDHGPKFGKSYARMYRRYLELYEEYWC